MAQKDEPHTIIETRSVENPQPSVVTAPVTVIAPGQDAVNTGGGSSIGRNVNTDDFVGRDKHIQFGAAGSNITFNERDNAVIWSAMMDHMRALSDVAIKLDGIPTIVKEILESIAKLLERVAKLEATKVELEVKPVTVPIVFEIPTWLRITIIVLVVLVTVGVSGVLYLVSRGG